MPEPNPLEEFVDETGVLMQNQLARLGIKMEYGEKSQGKNTLFDMANAMSNIAYGSLIQIGECMSYTIRNLYFGNDGGYISLW